MSKLLIFLISCNNCLTVILVEILKITLFIGFFK